MPVLSTIGAMAARGFGWLYQAAGVGYQAWVWGANASGQLADSTTVNKSSPIQIGTGANISVLAAGSASGAYVKTDGTLWMWGSGLSGRLGQGNTTNYSSPVQVGAGTTWLSVSLADNGATRALKTDGTLWGWGSNFNGELGVGTSGLNYSSPVQVGALTTWVETSGGNQFSLYRKSDGTIWSTGLNSNGQLGLGDTTSRSSPVQIGALTTWAFLGAAGPTAGAAIKTDGTLWAWGANASGQLGQGNTTQTSSPVQVGALTTWAKIQRRTGRASVAAVKTDGTLWMWGGNAFGQLGQGNITDYSSPVQVGAATYWTYAQSDFHTAAVTTSNQLWAWGDNSAGQLGQNNTTNRSSPVQVGAATTWVDLSVAAQITFALRS